MRSVRVSGTEGYADEAEALLQRYESLRFADVHRQVLHLIPTAPRRILDIGAGTGRDAAGFAALGHRVVAVEPTGELRRPAIGLHPSARIEWVDDSLPELASPIERADSFDVVMLTAVWMHLDERQRRRAMPVIARLVRPAGVTIFSLRHGPVPPGRRMFEVSADETATLAEAEGLRLILKLEHQSGRQAGISWTRVAFAMEG